MEWGLPQPIDVQVQNMLYENIYNDVGGSEAAEN